MHKYLKLTCDQCGDVHERYTTVIENVGKRGYVNVTLQFWCRKCEAPQAYIVGHNGKTAQVEERIDPATLFLPMLSNKDIVIRPKQSSYKS